MAINTHTKRRAATALPWHVIPPVPDFGLSSFDRGHIAGYYRHINDDLSYGMSHDRPSTQSSSYDRPSTQSSSYDRPSTQSR